VLNVIGELAKEGVTMIIVIHEMDFAMSISDRIVFMENGVIELDAAPDAAPDAIRHQHGAERVRPFNCRRTGRRRDASGPGCFGCAGVLSKRNAASAQDAPSMYRETSEPKVPSNAPA